MVTSALYRWSAICGWISGLSILVGKILAYSPYPQVGEIFDFISPLSGLLAVSGIYLWQREKAGRFGILAFGLVFIGLALLTCLDFFGAFIRLQLSEATRVQIMEGPAGLIAMFSGLIFLLGEILFGISVLRAGIFSKIAA
jgi:hypothetical protein